MTSRRVLAVDPGARRIGLALSDPSGRVAMPLEVVAAGPDLLDRLAKIAAAYEVGEIVVGLPRSLHGGEGREAKTARRMAAEIESRLGLPVLLVDERFTSAAAGRAFDEAEVGERKRRPVIDKVAAALLLQGYLDSRRPS